MSDLRRKHEQEMFDILFAAFAMKTADELARATIYHDALAALIRRKCDDQHIDGHSFTFEVKSRVAGQIVLRATDSFDGKAYTVTVEPEGK